MSVLRTRASCPRCSAEEEVWYYKGSIVPTESIDCRSCNYVYDASNFICSILDLYQNVTVSSSSVLSKLA